MASKSLKTYFAELGILHKHRVLLRHYLGVLHEKHSESFEHSLRVGSKLVEIARCLDISPKALFFPGILHDIGKTLVYDRTLRKVSGFSDVDREEMAHHPEFGYRLLQGAYEFSAQVVVRHHTFQRAPYPQELPPKHSSFSPETFEKVERYARLVALADFYDAIGRANDRNGGLGSLTKKKRKGIIIEENPDRAELIQLLYRKGIFV